MTTDTTTDIDLAKLEALARAASPGPWFAQAVVGYRGALFDVRAEHQRGVAGSIGNPSDATYIAAANPATVLQLIQLARRSTSGSDLLEAASYLYRAIVNYDGPAGPVPIAPQSAMVRALGQALDVAYAQFANSEQASGSDGTAAARIVVREGAWELEQRSEAAEAFMRNYADAGMEKLLGGYDVQPIIRRLAAAILEWQTDVLKHAPDGVCGVGPTALTGQAAGAVCQPLADERALRHMFERDAEKFLGSPMVAYAPGFQKDDDDGYQYANTRRLFDFWKSARNAALAQQAGVHATAYAVYGINASGKHYVRTVKQLDPASDWKIDDDGLGDRWAGNEVLGVIAAPSPSAERDSRDAKDAARYRVLRQNVAPRDVSIIMDMSPKDIPADQSLAERIDMLCDRFLERAAMSQAKTQGTAGQRNPRPDFSRYATLEDYQAAMREWEAEGGAV
jgi:hypothetical protein